LETHFEKKRQYNAATFRILLYCTECFTLVLAVVVIVVIGLRKLVGLRVV